MVYNNYPLDNLKGNLLSLLIISSWGERLDRNLINVARYCGRRLLVIIMRDAVPRPDCRMHNLTEYECTARWSVYKYLYRLIYHRRDEENSRNGSKWSTIIGISYKLFKIISDLLLRYYSIYIGVKFQKHFFKNIIQFLISTWRGAKRRDCVAWKLGRKLKYCSWKKGKKYLIDYEFSRKTVKYICSIYSWKNKYLSLESTFFKQGARKEKASRAQLE